MARWQNALPATGFKVKSLACNVKFTLCCSTFHFESSAPSAPLANSAIMTTLTIPCWWEDEMGKEQTYHPPSYAEV